MVVGTKRRQIAGALERIKTADCSLNAHAFGKFEVLEGRQNQYMLGMTKEIITDISTEASTPWSLADHNSRWALELRDPTNELDTKTTRIMENLRGLAR